PEKYSLNRAGLALVWSQRYLHGFGMQINATPGLYSDLESVSGEDFSVPFGVTAIQALSKNFAFFAGVRVYPSFQKVVDPVAGIYWSSRNDVVVQLGYPESRFEYSPNNILRFIAGARLWLWPDYNMGDDERQRLLFSEGRTFGGIELACGKHTLLTMKGGYLFSRKISFEEEADDVEIDNAPFVSLGLSGRF
ncbi:MAG: DUF6268 family outer membrane beta-barrel protein, partial [Kiritimatiellae bacterium]|nr:DUF6268 family outer membrane beta-barrel protein [Kiritimatiellia bacterium]